MPDYRVEHEIEVRFRDCDPMGHANNAVYLTYLEQGRFHFWRTVMGAQSTSDFRFILARVEIDYRRPATMGERLLVRLRVASIGRSSFAFEYRIVNARTLEVVAEAKSVQVMFDYAAGTSIPIPDDIRAKLDG
jgi:acyl-CoA thioester hydrolase